MKFSTARCWEGQTRNHFVQEEALLPGLATGQEEGTRESTKKGESVLNCPIAHTPLYLTQPPLLDKSLPAA